MAMIVSIPLLIKFTVISNTKKVLRCGAASVQDLDELPTRIQDLLSRIRPHAVKLVDAWMIPDYLLDR